MRAKAVDLFHAYTENLVPPEGAVLVTARDDGGTAPLAYEIVAFDAIDAIHGQAEGLELEARGTRLTVTFAGRDGGGKTEEEPLAGPRALFVRCPADKDFAFLFPPTDAAPSPLRTFLEKTFIAESNLPPGAAREVAKRIVERLALFRKGNP